MHEYGISTGIYRSRYGIFLGVLKGIAEHFDLSVFWLRVVFVIALVTTGFFPMGLLYILAGLLMKPAPRWAA